MQRWQRRLTSAMSAGAFVVARTSSGWEEGAGALGEPSFDGGGAFAKPGFEVDGKVVRTMVSWETHTCHVLNEGGQTKAPLTLHQNHDHSENDEEKREDPEVARH